VISLKEKEIMELITSEYSWEQIIYRIIAWEGMDPWDLDITMLSKSFAKYITRMDELDFKVPAKYIIIAAVLLRMKSDHLDFIEQFVYGEQDMDSLEEQAESETVPPDRQGFELELNPITVPARRQPTRRIGAAELISALRSALRTQERKSERRKRHRKAIQIREDNITSRINELYSRIDSMLSQLRGSEVAFSRILSSGNREEIVNTFIPLVHLEHQRKLECRQDSFFDEIFISKLTAGRIAEIKKGGNKILRGKHAEKGS
jgi:segregation and condensation protein A